MVLDALCNQFEGKEKKIIKEVGSLLRKGRRMAYFYF